MSLKDVGIFAIELFVLKIVYENTERLNSMFTEQIPVGYIACLLVGLIVVNSVYKTVKFDIKWLRRKCPLSNVLFQVGCYLVVVSVILSVNPFNYTYNSSQFENVFDIDTVGKTTSFESLKYDMGSDAEYMECFSNDALYKYTTVSKDGFGNIRVYELITLDKSKLPSIYAESEYETLLQELSTTRSNYVTSIIFKSTGGEPMSYYVDSAYVVYDNGEQINIKRYSPSFTLADGAIKYTELPVKLDTSRNPKLYITLMSCEADSLTSINMLINGNVDCIDKNVIELH